jgi:hypothetical protein
MALRLTVTFLRSASTLSQAAALTTTIPPAPSPTTPVGLATAPLVASDHVTEAPQASNTADLTANAVFDTPTTTTPSPAKDLTSSHAESTQTLINDVPDAVQPTPPIAEVEPTHSLVSVSGGDATSQPNQKTTNEDVAMGDAPPVAPKPQNGIADTMRPIADIEPTDCLVFVSGGNATGQPNQETTNYNDVVMGDAPPVVPKPQNDENLPPWLVPMIKYLCEVAVDILWQDLIMEFIEFEKAGPPNGVSSLLNLFIYS